MFTLSIPLSYVMFYLNHDSSEGEVEENGCMELQWLLHFFQSFSELCLLKLLMCFSFFYFHQSSIIEQNIHSVKQSISF